jgi:hypothetical protein
MKYIDRQSVDVPASLSGPSAAITLEKDCAERHYLTYDPSDPAAKAYRFVEYAPYDVKHALEKMSREKCAYCEGALGDGLNVEHFRPKGPVIEAKGHPGYWWLAHSWTNLLPSCNGCNQRLRQHLVTESMTEDELAVLLASRPRRSHGKGNQFPIKGVRAVDPSANLSDEEHYLLDPTSEDPEPFFKWVRTGAFSLVTARPADVDTMERALKSISVYALNRAKLVKRRTKALNVLRLQAERILQDLEEDRRSGGSSESLNRALLQVNALGAYSKPDCEFSAMASAFIAEFSDEIVALAVG